jgi:hypothetical protein
MTSTRIVMGDQKPPLRIHEAWGWWLADCVAEPGQCEDHDDVSFCFVRHEMRASADRNPSTG